MNTFLFITLFTNVKNIGFSLFDCHGLSFILCGFILLLGLIGAIVLTLTSVNQVKFEIKQQKSFLQILRFSKSSIFLADYVYLFKIKK